MNRYRKQLKVLLSRYPIPPFEEDEIKEFIVKYCVNKDDLKDLDTWVKSIHTETKGHPMLVKFFLEDMLRKGHKLLVAVDNAHDERTAGIFYVIQKMIDEGDIELKKNIRFIIASRLPDLDWLIDDRLGKYITAAEQEQLFKLSDMCDDAVCQFLWY